MKVIFIEDVPRVARAGQTRVVADGYARNYLFRQKLAVLADSPAAVALEAHLKKIVKQKALEEAEMAEFAKKISGTEIVLKAKVGENDRLYGSVTGADIAEELGKAVSREIDKRKVELAEPIRQVGVYDVTIRFIRDITAVVCVTVMSDEEGAVKPERVTAEAETEEEKVEKKPKAEKKAVQEEDAAGSVEVTEEPVAEVKAEKKEKKAKAPKAEKTEEAVEAAVSEDAPAAEKKEKKPRAPRAKKTEEKTEE